VVVRQSFIISCFRVHLSGLYGDARCIGFDVTQTSSYQVCCDVQHLPVSFYLMNPYEEVYHEGARLSKTAL
jgi:hypothetical protein